MQILGKPTSLPIGEIILQRFLREESIVEIAEDYNVNCSMIEEVIRQKHKILLAKSEAL